MIYLSDLMREPWLTLAAPPARRMLSANERNRAKTPGTAPLSGRGNVVLLPTTV